MVQIGNFFYKYRNGILPLLFFGVFLPSPMLLPNPLLVLIIGLTTSTLGQLIRGGTIGLVYIIRGGKDGKVYAQDLVTTGIFAHCRNPLYVGNILVATGMGVASNNLYFLLLITAVIVFIYMAIVAAEEAFLENKFGDVYRAYARDVNRWLPSWQGIGNTFEHHAFAWRRVVLKEYNSTFTGTTLGILLIAKSVYDNPDFYTDPRATYSVLFVVWMVVLVVYGWVKFLKKTHRLQSA